MEEEKRKLAQIMQQHYKTSSHLPGDNPCVRDDVDGVLGTKKLSREVSRHSLI